MASGGGERSLERGAESGPTGGALEHARALLSDDARTRADGGGVRAGFLDLLDREGVGSTGRAQDLMLSRRTIPRDL
jgi:hypothetical protein